MIKNLPAMQETWFRSLGWEDPLEEGMATPSSILARRIPMEGEPGRLQIMASQNPMQLNIAQHTLACAEEITILYT